MLAAATAGSAPAAAANRGPLRAIVRVTSSQDWAQSTRIRGQTSDLDVDLAEVPSAALEPRRPEQIDAAGLLARQLGGDLVIWFQGADVLMFVASPSPGYLLVRPVVFEPGARAPDLEGTALGVRSVVKALREGTLIRTGEATSPPSPMPLAATGSVALAFAHDGVDFAPGMLAQLGVLYGRAEAGVFAGTFTAHTLTTDFDRAFVSRQIFGLSVGAELMRWRRLQLFAAAAAGGARFRLRTEDRSDEWPDVLRPLLGVDLQARVPILTRSPIRLEVVAGVAVDMVLDPPALTSPSTEMTWTFAGASPRAAVALRLSGGRDLP